MHWFIHPIVVVYGKTLFLNEEEQGGGPVTDIATHSLDLTLYLMNNYESAMVLGKTHKCIEYPEAGNVWSDNGVSETTLEESACTLIVMINGSTIMLETDGSQHQQPDSERELPSLQNKSGLFVKGEELPLTKIELGRPIDTKVDLGTGKAAFYSGASKAPHIVKAHRRIGAPPVLPKQACVVLEILEAIYTLSKTGKAMYFK